MMGRGRPFRFVATVGGGWFAARVLLLWPVTGSLPEAIREALPFAAASDRADGVERRALRRRLAPALTAERDAAPAPTPASTASAADRADVRLALLGLVRYGVEPTPLRRSQRLAAQPPAIAVLVLPLAADPPRTRLTGSAWFVARRSGDESGPRLGGGQAGVRLRWRLDPADRIALAARVATPLAGVGREAAIGVEWRPIAAPIAIVAEHRFGIDGAAGGPTVMAIGGVDSVPVVGKAALSAYAQGGAVARARIEPFVDGAARIAYPIGDVGGLRIDAGVGAWGAAQRGSARVDLGPGIGAVLPIAGRSVRLGLDWRERIAGNAAPGSGLTLSLGTDF